MSDSSGLYSLVVACFLPGAGGLFKAATLKTDLFNKWQGRADDMYAGLTQGAIRLLLTVQEETITLLGGPGAAFQPNTFTADPGPLVARVSRFQAAMKARDRLQRRLRWLLRLGPWLVTLASVYLAGWLLASIYFVGLNHGTWLRDTGLGLAGSAAVAALVAVATYVYLVGRLSSTEVLVYEVSAERDVRAAAVPPLEIEEAEE